MSEVDRRGSGDNDGSAWQNRRSQNSEKRDKKFDEHRETMDGRGDKHRHGERTRDGKPGKGDRGFPERRAGRPYRNRDERRGNERRRDDRGRKPMRARPGHDSGGRPAGRGRTSPQRDLPMEPELPESVEFTDLDIEVRRELRTLPKNLAERVGRHLVAAGMLIDDDLRPPWPMRDMRSRRHRAFRSFEKLGLTAYRAGNGRSPLELRAVRRMTRSDMRRCDRRCRTRLNALSVP